MRCLEEGCENKITRRAEANAKAEDGCCREGEGGKALEESCEPAPLATNNPKPARQRAPSANPKGIASSSPRLRGTSYLGSTSNKHSNRNAVVSVCSAHRVRGWPQPRCGCSCFATFTQGRRWCANLGLWAAAPLGLARAVEDGENFSAGSSEPATMAANNPKGIVTSSPRLRGTSYLGLRFVI